MSVEKIKQKVSELGSRKVSESLVNQKVMSLCMLSMNDLPDSSDLWDVVDEIEMILDTDDYTIEDIKGQLECIDMDTIYDLVYS